MRKIILLILITVMISGFQCKLFKKDKGISEDLIINESNKTSNIDFKSHYEKIKKADRIDLDIFISISVLHKNYVSQFIGETQNMNENERQLFFDSKKKDFFKTIKFSEDDYLSFLEKNLEKLNEYQNIHPEIREYLTTFN